MFRSIGMPEFTVIFIVVILIFGPTKLPAWEISRRSETRAHKDSTESRYLFPPFHGRCLEIRSMVLLRSSAGC
jgi:hypothetical protein